MNSFAIALSNLLLGRDRSQRLRASQSLLAAATMAVFAVVQQWEVSLGLLDQRASNLLSLGYLGGSLVFYLLIRLGHNQRVSSDPSLTLPQTFYAVGCLAWSYAIHGPTRGGVLMLILLVIIYGMFSLTARQAGGLGAFAFAALVVAIACKAALRLPGFEWDVERAHLALFGTTLVGASAVSARLNAMRRRLKAQKEALEEALSRITMLATRDELTGLLNRRAAMEALRAEADRRARARTPLSLVIVDLDFFKRVNDERGHQAGDMVLQAFAGVAQAAVRSTDVLSRWGGEEFLLVMPDAPVIDALAVLDRVRQRLAAHRFDGPAAGLAVTFSAGVSECVGAADIEPSIERADKALYRAKHEGRNRSSVAATAD